MDICCKLLLVQFCQRSILIQKNKLEHMSVKFISCLLQGCFKSSVLTCQLSQNESTLNEAQGPALIFIFLYYNLCIAIGNSYFISYTVYLDSTLYFCLAYNDIREFCGLNQAKAFDGLANEIRDSNFRSVLSKVYKQVFAWLTHSLPDQSDCLLSSVKTQTRAPYYSTLQKCQDNL